MKKIALFVVIMMMRTLTMADEIDFKAGCNVTSVVINADSTSWRVKGAVSDRSIAGFTAYGLETNHIMACESPYGDIDIYVVTNIVERDSVNATFDVIYSGTGTTSRIGQPVLGQTALCNISTNIIPLAPGIEAASISEYLHQGLYNEALRRIMQSFVLTNDSRTLNFTTLYVTNAYRTSTNDLYMANELITSEGVDIKIAALSSEVWFGTTNTHSTMPNAYQLETDEATNYWYVTNSLAVGTNYLGAYYATNILYRNVGQHGEYHLHFHVRVDGLGNPTVSAYAAVVATTTDGATTNILDTIAARDISDATSLSEFDIYAHVNTNVYFSEERVLGVLWYGVRSGGSSANLITAGGNGYSTSIRTPNISNPRPDVDAYYMAIYGSNTVVAISNLLASSGGTDYWNEAHDIAVVASNLASFVGVTTNAISGIWGLNMSMNLVPMEYPQALMAGLWQVNNNGTVSPSTNNWYDTLWFINSSGALVPR